MSVKLKGQLNKRMNGHRSEINHGGNQSLYQHFNQPNHSVLSLKVRILEKRNHPSNSPQLSTCTRHRRKREYWIRQLVSATPYGSNDKIDIALGTSPAQEATVNMMRLFPIFSRHYSPPNLNNFSIDSLVTEKLLGFHHIRTKLYSLQIFTVNPLSMKVSRLACLIQIHQNILASYLMSLTTGYTNRYLPIHILQRKESF